MTIMQTNMQTKALEYRHLDISQLDDWTVVEFVDLSLADHIVIDQLKAEMEDFYLATHPRKVLVDFSRVRWSSSSGINALLKLREHVVADGGQLKLCNMNASVRDKYRSLNLDGRVLDIFESRADALAAH